MSDKPTRPLMTQDGSNRRLAAYLVIAGCAYFIDKGQTPPHGWGVALFVVGLVSTLAVNYRAYIDTSDGEAKTGLPEVPASPEKATQVTTEDADAVSAPAVTSDSGPILSGTDQPPPVPPGGLPWVKTKETAP